MDVSIPGSPILRNRTPLLGVLPLFLALLFFIVGASLLNDEVSNSDVSQTTKAISGAMFVSFALISMFIALKGWWKNRKSDTEELRNNLE
jgi:hypothetical protein